MDPMDPVLREIVNGQLLAPSGSELTAEKEKDQPGEERRADWSQKSMIKQSQALLLQAGEKAMWIPTFYEPPICQGE